MTPQLSHYYRKRAEMIILLGGKCVDCSACDGLEFDHTDPSEKLFDIGSWYGLSMDRLMPELIKCQLRCKKCHGIKTKKVDGREMVCGKYSMYRHGKCRCALCREANRLQQKLWRENNFR